MASTGVSLASLAPHAPDTNEIDFFEVIALSEPLDKGLLKSKITREQAAEAIKGKVVGWGMWVGSCERRWT